MLLIKICSIEVLRSLLFVVIAGILDNPVFFLMYQLILSWRFLAFSTFLYPCMREPMNSSTIAYFELCSLVTPNYIQYMRGRPITLCVCVRGVRGREGEREREIQH